MMFTRSVLLSLALASCTRPSAATPPAHDANRASGPGVVFAAPRSTPPPPPAPEADQRDAARSSNAFGADLYRSVRSQPGNLVFSPASITLAFGMTEAGARGDTSAQLRSAFHFALPEERLHAALGTLARTWNHGEAGRFELATANRLFGQRGWPFVPAFLDLTSRLYDAPLEAVDFRANPDAQRTHINTWVSDRTHARILDLLPQDAVSTDTRMVLVNAVYLHAQWAAPFAREETYPAPFHPRGAAATVDVPTMHRTRSFATAARDGYQVLEMPYSEPGFVFDIVMPDAVDGIAALETRWQSSTPDAFFAGLGQAERALSLPKFRVAPDGMRLSQALRALGVLLAFDRGAADFTGIAPIAHPDDRLYVSEAFHKAFIAVDETGTEAAAATAVVVTATSAAMLPPAPPQPFVVDRPFLFFLRDTSSGAILFAGRVEDPR
ncbi:MAG: serpin family protein [Deltaproteobacteria bacterium]